MSRPYCQQPTACQAKGAGHCRSCAIKHKFTDPTFAAAHAKRSSEHFKRLHADPAFKAAHVARNRKLKPIMHADPELKAALSARMKRLWAIYKEANQ